MNLNPVTLNILKNFSIINPSVVIKSGKILTTISPAKTILAKAEIPDEFPETFGIYALNRFLSTLSLFDVPTLEFNQNSVRIFDSTRSVVYHYSDPSVILVPPEKELKLPSVDAECQLLNKGLNAVLKALSVLNLPEIAIVGDGTNISLQAVDSKNSSSDTFNITIGNTNNNFRAIFKAENLKIIEDDYTLKISSKGISQFVGNLVTYWVAIESSSTFE
jgi:hypothetical protein